MNHVHCRILRNLSLTASQDHFKRHNVPSQITLILVIITNSWSIHNIVLCNHAIFLLLNQKTLISNIWPGIGNMYLALLPHFCMHVPAFRWAHFISVSRTAFDISQYLYPLMVSPARSFLSASHMVSIKSSDASFSLSLSSFGKFSPTSLQWRLLRVRNQDGFPWCQLLLLVDGFSDSIEGESPLQLGNLGDVLALGGSLLLQQQKHIRVLELVPITRLLPWWTTWESRLRK